MYSKVVFPQYAINGPFILKFLIFSKDKIKEILKLHQRNRFLIFFIAFGVYSGVYWSQILFIPVQFNSPYNISDRYSSILRLFANRIKVFSYLKYAYKIEFVDKYSKKNRIWEFQSKLYKIRVKLATKQFHYYYITILKRLFCIFMTERNQDQYSLFLDGAWWQNMSL